MGSNFQQWCFDVFDSCLYDDCLDVLKGLITRDNVNTLIPGVYVYQTSALELACHYGHLDAIKWLVEEMKADLGESLIEASVSSNIECVKYMLECRMDVNYKSQRHNGRTAIFFPYKCDVVQLLIESGADIHIKDINGIDVFQSTCIIHKKHCDGASEKIARLLIQYGACLRSDGFQWMLDEQDKVKKQRQHVSQAGFALMFVFKKKRVPKDLSRHVVKHMVLPPEFLNYQKKRKVL
jgi:hypothetical protein